MSLENWAKNGWIRKHETSPQEIKSLFDIVDRDLQDARRKELSSDWRFGIAYNAALKVCTILLYAKGYRPERSLAHYRTLQALPLILGKEKIGDATYLDKCRKTRNTAEYDQIGVTTVNDAEELIEFVEDLKFEAKQWLKSNHKGLLGL
jgi:uncharacterized protein (UPF0332 family)